MEEGSSVRGKLEQGSGGGLWLLRGTRGAGLGGGQCAAASGGAGRGDSVAAGREAHPGDSGESPPSVLGRAVVRLYFRKVMLAAAWRWRHPDRRQ